MACVPMAQLTGESLLGLVMAPAEPKVTTLSPLLILDSTRELCWLGHGLTQAQEQSVTLLYGLASALESFRLSREAAALLRN